MQTVFDWLTVMIFAGLAVLFLQRSLGPRPANDRVIAYLPPAIGCALANTLGNHGWGVVATVLMTATIAYIWLVLKPLDRGAGDDGSSRTI